MRRRWFGVTLRGAAAQVLADRGAIAVAVGFYIVVVSVLSALWRAAASAHGGHIVGYSGIALTWYMATSEAATCALNIRMIEEIGDDIGSGAVAAELLRPASVLGVRVAAQVGRALPRLAACIVVGALFCLATVGPPPSWLAAGITVISLVLAITCNLVAQHAFAASAFWVRDARSTWFLYQKFVFVLGGMLLPLQVLPGWLHAVAACLPFMAMSYAPARFASGHIELWLLLVQVGWIGALSLVAHVVFTAGENRLQVVGG